MKYTANYQLNQWDAQDAVKRTDFNADNAKIDAALKEQAAAVAAETAARKSAVAAEASARGTLGATVAKCGNCKIVYGSYIGTGTYGSANPTTLTFDGKPLFVAVMPKTISGQSARGLQMVRESPITYTFPEYFASECTITWKSNGVSWHNASNADYQFNGNGVTYCYVALLPADE